MRTTSETTSKIIAAFLAAVILMLFWLLVSGSFAEGAETSASVAVSCFAAMGAMGYFARFFWFYEDLEREPSPHRSKRMETPTLPVRLGVAPDIAHITYDRNLLYLSVDELLTRAAQEEGRDRMAAYACYKAALDRAGHKSDRWNVLFQLASALDRDHAADAMRYAHASLGCAQMPQQAGGSFGLIGLIHAKRKEYEEAADCAMKEAEQFEAVSEDIRFYEKYFSALAKAGDCWWSIYQGAPALSKKRQEAWNAARVAFDRALSLADRRGLWSVDLSYGSTGHYLARLCAYEAEMMRMQGRTTKAREWERRARRYKPTTGVSGEALEYALLHQG